MAEKGKTTFRTDGKGPLLKEGKVVRGGVLAKPPTPRPAAPKAMAPKGSTSQWTTQSSKK